ncbi:unnamed protein product, partial [Owenia fusiformis]
NMEEERKFKKSPRRLYCIVIIIIGFLFIYLFIQDNRFEYVQYCDDKEIKKILLLTYARGGSTFTAELFNQHPDAFFSYEPLFTTDIKDMADIARRILTNQKNIAVRRGLTYSNHEAQDVINNIFTCHLHRIPLTAVTHHYVMLKGSLSNVYSKCFVSSLMTWGPTNCLQNNCMTSKIRTIKTILLRMNAVKGLLRQNPHLKIIHLVRDPRGILMSRWRTFGKDDVINTAKVGAEAEELCTTMLNDVKLREELAKNHSMSFFYLRYEDLAENPLKIAGDIYDFVDMPFHDTVKAWFAKNDTQGGKFETTRHNMKKTSYSWRDKIPWEFANIIDATCSRINEKLGYKRAESLEQLRDRSFSLRVQTVNG